MAKCVDLSKEGRVKREYAKLRRTFRDIDKNMMQTVDSLLHNAAFMAVTMEDLRNEINLNGWETEYHHGGGQSGTKQTEAVRTYNTMTKNLNDTMKILKDLTPPVRKKKSALQELRDE